MSSLFIYLNGRPQSGKDTVANFLCAALPDAKKFRLAEPIRKAVAAFAGQYIDTQEFKASQILPPHPLTVREFMIAFSEEFVKSKLGLTAFAKALTIRAGRALLFNDIVIIPDSGFSYEVTHICRAFPDAKHIVIRVVRPNYPIIPDSREILQMPSYTIVNDGTLDQLNARVRAIAKELTSG